MAASGCLTFNDHLSGRKTRFSLFDSILREYPISTLLIWKTNNDEIRRRKFIDNWNDALRLSDFYVPKDAKKKCLVLDGQQRLQSLFIALSGSYEGRELYFDILSGDLAEPEALAALCNYGWPGNVRELSS